MFRQLIRRRLLPLRYVTGPRAFVPALVVLGVGMAVHYVTLYHLGNAPSTTFFVYTLAILVGAWTGYAPGLFVTFAVFAILPFVFHPGYTVGQINWLGGATLAVVSLVVSRISADLRHAETELRTLNASLEQGIQQKTSEAEAAAQQLQAALQAGRMGTWEYTIATGAVRWSPGLEAIHGYAPGTFPGTFDAFRREIHPEDRDRVLAAITEAAEQHRDHHVEYRIVRSDGAIRWVEGTGQVMRDEHGRTDRMVGICTDITERKQSEERFHLAVEAAPAAMIMVDERGTIVLVNALTERLLGYARGELVGRSIEMLVPARFRASHTAFRASFLAHAEQRPMGPGRDLYALRKDGSEVPVEIGLSPIETSLRRLVLAAVTDITERKQVERQRAELLEREQAARAELERASRMKDEFLAVLSHELRTPLNAVLGYAQILGTGVLSHDQTQHALAAIQRNALAQARLIESLLDLSRIMANKLELDLGQIDLSGLVETAVDVLRPEAGRKGVTIDVAVPATTLVGDAARLQQVMWNLLSNAIKFTPSGGRVRVHASCVDTSVRIQVSDTGRGIAPDSLPHVFERYWQSKSEDTGGSRGLGVGLTLVREIVQAHKGTIAGESPGIGLGSTFTVTLPLAGPGRVPSHPSRATSMPEGVPQTPQAVDVLIVDDDADSRELLVLALESWGAVVRKASSSAEALAAIGARKPDILLADMRMPDDDGYSLIRKVRAQEIERHQPRLAALAVTAYASPSDRERTLAAGYDGHIAKPFDPGELSRAVVQVLGSGFEVLGSNQEPRTENLEPRT